MSNKRRCITMSENDRSGLESGVYAISESVDTTSYGTFNHTNLQQRRIFDFFPIKF